MNVQVMALSELCEVLTKGTTPTTLGYEFQEKGIGFLKIECFDEMGDFIPDKMVYISEECNEKMKRSQLKQNDILFSIAGAIGRVAIVSEDMLPANTNQALAIIRIKKDNIFIPYIKLILTSNIVKNQYNKQKQGVAQLNLSLKDIGNLRIPICSYEKQIQYVNLFDSIRKLIGMHNSQLKAYDTLVKSRFVEMFGDPMVNDKKFVLTTFGDKFELNAGGTPSKQCPEYWNNGTISWIGSNMCQNNIIYNNDGNYITEQGLNHSSARVFPIDTVLVALVGATIGKTALLKFETTTNQNVLGIRGICKNGYTPEFIFYYIQGLYQKFLSIGDGGFAMASKGFISELPLPIVNMKEQIDFTNFVQQVNKTKSAVQKSLDETQLLFDSLMQKYFG